MGWKDLLRPASFRNVPFEVRVREMEGGKRTARHEIFNRDLPFIEELGRRAHEFQVEAYVLGDSYFEARQALIAVLDKEGAGTLQLPYDDAVAARCLRWRVREAAEEGGGAFFDLIFEEVGEAEGTVPERDPRNDAKRDASIFRNSVESQLEQDLAVDGVAEPAREATAGEVKTWGQRLREMRLFADDIQASAEFAAKVNRLLLEATELALSPADLVIATREALSAILAGAENSLEAFCAYRALFGAPSSISPAATSTGAAAAANADLVNLTVRGQALGYALEAAVDAAWESLDQVLEARAFVLAEVDSLEALTGAEAYQALQNLKAAAMRVMPVEDEDLPRLASLLLDRPMPSLVVAYQLYDNARREGEIVNRNRPRHPGFMPAGETLQVLVHG